MVMLACGLFIIVACKIPPHKFADGSVFRAGLIGVVGVFGISWLTGTFFDGYHDQFVSLFKTMAESTPLLFGLVLFFFSAVILSPSATVVALMPLGAAIGIPPLLWWRFTRQPAVISSFRAAHRSAAVRSTVRARRIWAAGCSTTPISCRDACM